MKREIDSIRRLEVWFLNPTPVVFQRTAPTSYTVRFDGISLSVSVSLGCAMDKRLATTTATSNSNLLHPKPRTDAQPTSPMIPFGLDDRTPADTIRNSPKDMRKNNFLGLERPALQKGFAGCQPMADDLTAVVPCIEDRAPV